MSDRYCWLEREPCDAEGALLSTSFQPAEGDHVLFTWFEPRARETKLGERHACLIHGCPAAAPVVPANEVRVFLSDGWWRAVRDGGGYRALRVRVFEHVVDGAVMVTASEASVLARADLTRFGLEGIGLDAKELTVEKYDLDGRLLGWRILAAIGGGK